MTPTTNSKTPYEVVANNKSPYDAMTDAEFQEILEQVVYENARTLLSVPGAYEVFAEHYNNEVLERWAARGGIEVPEDGEE